MSYIAQYRHIVSRWSLLLADPSGTAASLTGAALAPAIPCRRAGRRPGPRRRRDLPAPVRVPSRQDDAGSRFGDIAVGRGRDDRVAIVPDQYDMTHGVLGYSRGTPRPQPVGCDARTTERSPWGLQTWQDRVFSGGVGRRGGGTLFRRA